VLRVSVLKSMGSILWTFLFLVLVQFFTAYSFSVMQSTYGVFIAMNFSWGTIELGVILCSAGIVIGAIQGGTVKKLSDKFGLCRLLQLGLLLLALGLLYALPRHANAELLPHFVLFYMLVAGFSICGTAVTGLVSTLSKDNVGALIGVAQGVGEVAGTLSPIISASLFAINSSGSSAQEPLVNFGSNIGQGALPNVITSALLLLLLLATPFPLKVIQNRLNSTKSTEVSLPTITPAVVTSADSASAPPDAAVPV
jgi:hypothetical protein